MGKKTKDSLKQSLIFSLLIKKKFTNGKTQFFFFFVMYFKKHIFCAQKYLLIIIPHNIRITCG